MKTKNYGIGTTTISQTVIASLWAAAVRQQVLAETVK